MSPSVFPVVKASGLLFYGRNFRIKWYQVFSCHELDQIRDLDLKDPEIATGINCALDCIGIERAGRSAISRSLSAIRDLDKDRVHKNLWLAKSQWLLSQGKFADCYHYIGKVGITCLLAKEERFLRRNIKVIETLLDLTSDSQTNHILHTQLVKASKDALGPSE